MKLGEKHHGNVPNFKVITNTIAGSARGSHGTSLKKVMSKKREKEDNGCLRSFTLEYKEQHCNSAVWVFKALALKQKQYDTTFQDRGSHHSEDNI